MRSSSVDNPLDGAGYEGSNERSDVIIGWLAVEVDDPDAEALDAVCLREEGAPEEAQEGEDSSSEYEI